MEPILASFNEEWESSLSEIFSNVEGDNLANNEYANTFSTNRLTSLNFLPLDEANLSINASESASFYNFSNSFHPNFYQFCEENSITSSASSASSPFFPIQSYGNHHFYCKPKQIQVSNENITSNNFWLQHFPCHVMEDFLSTKTEMVDKKSEDGFDQANNVITYDFVEELKLKRKTSMQEHEQYGVDRSNCMIESPKKKPRVPRDAQKEKRNALSKKNKKASMDDLVVNHGKTDSSNHSSSSSSGDDTINTASQDSKGELTASLNSSSKTRASRGAATDPQSLYARAQKEKRNALSKKNKKASLDDLVETNHGKTDSSNHPSTSSTENENINNGYEASKGEVTASLNSSGKTRASSGAATDPQSLYARKRREKINERLRILQKLVPNGTKVDISTMLEEAVQYVKFLKLQIKLLSSDEMWMFAPIAYNGMDMGLYDKVSL